MRNITPRILAPRVISATISTEGSEPNMISSLIESNRMLIEEVNGLKKQIFTMQNQFTRTMELVLAKLDGNVSPLVDPKTNASFIDKDEDVLDYNSNDNGNDYDNDSEESELEQLLDYNDFEESNYKTSIKKVAQQVDAECGYHALFNGLKCFTKKLSPNKLIPCFKKEIAENRNQIGDDQWLSEDELNGLIAEYKGVNSITLIGDISMYYDGIAGLEHSVLGDLAMAQQAIELLEDYHHVFILGTMNARNNRRFAHWIAVELVIEDGKINYSIMDSLQSSSCVQQIEQLQSILHIKQDRFAINLLEDKDIETRVSDYISQLTLAKIFEEGNRCYACKGGRTEDCPIIVNKQPESLIDSIINGAANLMFEVQNTSFWSTDGYIQPYEKILNALRNIKDCDQQCFVCKRNSFDPLPDMLPILELTFEQKEQIERIEREITNA